MQYLHTITQILPSYLVGLKRRQQMLVRRPFKRVQLPCQNLNLCELNNFYPYFYSAKKLEY